MHVKNLVVVLSTIKTVADRLTYARRSVFSHLERQEQTKATLISVRKRIPDSHVIFVDCTAGEELCQYYDVRLQPSDEKVCCEVTCPRKGLGEAALLMHALEYIERSDGLTFDNLWKINGRYSLTDGFDPSKWNSSCSEAHFYDTNTVCTVLYKICPEDFTRFKKFVSDTKLKFYENSSLGMENIYSAFPFKHIPQLHVEGKVSVSGENWSR